MAKYVLKGEKLGQEERTNLWAISLSYYMCEAGYTNS